MLSYLDDPLRIIGVEAVASRRGAARLVLLEILLESVIKYFNFDPS